MKKITVPIFTEEYKIVVIIGTSEERAKFVSKYCEGWDFNKSLDHETKTRGSAFNTLPKKHPLITLDGNLPCKLALCTLPHEASHCVNYIMNFLGIIDESGELMGHGISAVMRKCVNEIFKKKK
jgi:hypothetical protein